VDENLGFLRSVVEELRGRTRVDVLFVEAPVSPRFLQEYHHEALFESARRRFREFSRELGADYLDLNSEARLAPDDFYDWAHLRNADAVARCTDLVSARVARMFSNGRPHPGVRTDDRGLTR
jgi:hypothetical protein